MFPSSLYVLNELKLSSRQLMQRRHCTRSVQLPEPNLGLMVEKKSSTLSLCCPFSFPPPPPPASFPGVIQHSEGRGVVVAEGGGGGGESRGEKVIFLFCGPVLCRAELK